MSAFGPKQKSRVALHMSAFGGKADNKNIGPSRLLLAFTADHGTCIRIDEMEALTRNAFHRFTRGL